MELGEGLRLKLLYKEEVGNERMWREAGLSPEDTAQFQLHIIHAFMFIYKYVFTFIYKYAFIHIYIFIHMHLYLFRNMYLYSFIYALFFTYRIVKNNQYSNTSVHAIIWKSYLNKIL